MQFILQDPTPSALVQAIEANTIESFKTWGKWAKLELQQDPEISWTASDIPFFLFNVVLGLVPQTDHSPAESLKTVAAATSRASSRGMPMGWWVGLTNPDPTLGQLLEDQGWLHAATLTGMAVELQTLAEPASLPPGLTISQVKDGESLETWCQLMTSVSEFPDFAAEAWLDMYRAMEIVDDPQWSLYLGVFEGKPVSTSALFRGAGVAGIHGVATLPEYRGKGIATAMTYCPLLAAMDESFRVGVLFSSEMAVGIYRKMGFQEYGAGEIYMWQPEDESQ
ncbi:MAG: GNAT family N-acetyltransferase [Dehalococcoidia bacterium]|nr:GNAT family N-acetyltransferase [Dehalococcoidia bacterium]